MSADGSDSTSNLCLRGALIRVGIGGSPRGFMPRVPRLNIAYIRHRSLTLDVLLILKTFGAVLTRRGAS